MFCSSRWVRWFLCLTFALLAPRAAAAQHVTVDDSAVYRMYRIFEMMHGSASKDSVSAALDSVLATPGYVTMFHHYNRSWRPNHLPQPVFKRMILSLQFAEEYAAGENQRADQMLPLWRKFYGNLALYKANLQQLGEANVPAMTVAAAADAREWLPPEWAIPDYRLVIVPNGGSTAFTIDDAQGYDFFQLPRDSSGTIIWPELRSTIAHETHHLGVHPILPASKSLPDSIALEFLSIFMPEGTAVKLVNDFPGGCVPEVDDKRRDPAFKTAVAEWWNRYTMQEPEPFDRFVNTFEQARSGALSRDSLNAQIGSYWLAGYISPVYFIGAELFGAIYHAFGKEGAFSAMRDPRNVLPLYDAAIRKRPDLLRNCYVIPDSTIRHARAMQAPH